MPTYQFYREQVIRASKDVVWDFISSPQNLKAITPPSMGFDITSKYLFDKMYPGMIISYQVIPLAGIKTAWVTEITHVKQAEYFVDEQRSGPYKMWHHQHILEDHPSGVLMKDLITYTPPLGFIGAIANYLIIDKKLIEIFSYRESALKKIFPS